MKPNIGKIDQIIRAIFGIGFISIGLYFKSLFSIIGVVLLITAFIKKCYFYLPFGISTCKYDIKK